MSVKFYWSVWLAVGLIALGLFLSGNFSMMTVVIFGFIAFGLVFMGMMNVLPTIVAHPVRAQDAVHETPDLYKQAHVATRPIRTISSTIGKTGHPVH